jgi:hypothetical protein
MTVRVVGAGLGRTGTHSLKLALEQLLGGPCYHMLEVFGHPEHVPLWRGAVDGEPTDWDALLADFVAIVDWPGAAFWQELSEANPDALVLLSVRSDAQAWWRSVDDTIFQAIEQMSDGPEMGPWYEMVTGMLDRRFTPEWRQAEGAMAAYEAHNETVRRVGGSRVLEWRPTDGWVPICEALGLAVPGQPFPHVNSTAEFRTMVGLGPLPGESG